MLACARAACVAGVVESGRPACNGEAWGSVQGAEATDKVAYVESPVRGKRNGPGGIESLDFIGVLWQARLPESSSAGAHRDKVVHIEKVKRPVGSQVEGFATLRPGPFFFSVGIERDGIGLIQNALGRIDRPIRGDQRAADDERAGVGAVTPLQFAPTGERGYVQVRIEHRQVNSSVLADGDRAPEIVGSRQADFPTFGSVGGQAEQLPDGQSVHRAVGPDRHTKAKSLCAAEAQRSFPSRLSAYTPCATQ